MRPKLRLLQAGLVAGDPSLRVRHMKPNGDQLHTAIRTADHLFLLYCIGERKARGRTDRPVSYAESLVKLEWRQVQATARKRRQGFVGFITRTADNRLPKMALLGELVGGVRNWGRQEYGWLKKPLEAGPHSVRRHTNSKG